jgi:glycosyltransferase involved in cell wall biosynthesis
MKKPKISVLMSVYNGEKYLRQAINSILSQTFKNFEFIIVNDGSSDDTYKIASSYSDERIIIISNKKNLGLTKSLNIGLNITKGDYVARMDADDVSFPGRFEIQADFLDRNPDFGLVGSWVEYIGLKGKELGIKKNPTDYSVILKKILRYNTFVHSSLMIRRSVLEKVEGYNEQFKFAQDYDLILKIAKLTKVTNLPKVLLSYRINPQEGISFKQQKKQEWSAILARIEALKSRQYPLLYWFFLLKPIVSYLIPSSIKVFLVKNLFWRLNDE